MRHEPPTAPDGGGNAAPLGVDGDIIVALDRADLLRIVAGLVEADGTVSGATVITSDGELSYVDAGTLRRGGGRA